MKKFLPVFFILCLTSLAIAQNLVPNWQFEEHSNCPANFDDFYAVGWESAGVWQTSLSTPDYLHTCAIGPTLSIPQNACGYQVPLSGDAYCGIIAFVTSGADYREIIQAQLGSNMIVGAVYNVSMYVSTAFSYTVNHANLATNKLGFRFSTTSFGLSNPPLINNWAHVYTDSVISDTLNWVLLQGTFIADSNYQYVLIGNFFDDQNTTIVQVGQNYTKAYYYIENVCVALSSEQCSWATSTTTLQANEELKLFPNPCNDVLNITGRFKESGTVKIMDMLGRRCIEQPYPNSNNIFTIDISKFPEGPYLLLIEEGDQLFSRSFIIQR